MITIEQVVEEMGSAWVSHVRESARHEYHKHTEYHEVMSLKQYQDYRLVQQYNHILTHLHFVRKTSDEAMVWREDG